LHACLLSCRRPLSFALRCFASFALRCFAVRPLCCAARRRAVLRPDSALFFLALFFLALFSLCV
jgi:hypothetical protein